MSNGKEQKVRDVLRNMNLTEDENNPEKDPFQSNSKIANRLGSNITSTNVATVRRNLIFARDIEVCIDNYYVYAWRWSGDKRYAKIGKSMGHSLRERLITTYHPTDNPIWIGHMKCLGKKEAQEKETSILDRFKRSHPKREWIIINKDFNELIDKKFTQIEKIVE